MRRLVVNNREPMAVEVVILGGIFFLVPVVCYNTYLTLPPAAHGIVNRNHFNERVD